MKKINNVLLIDDDIGSNYIIKLILNEMDLVENITVCSNGLEAIITLEKECFKGEGNSCPDLVFLDINMPMMDGYEFLAALKAFKPQDKHIPIYILSSSQEAQDIEKARSYGVEGYIVKPLTHEIIEQITERLVY